ncbi:MAG: DUF3467 domain-containing protein [Chitinophagia bacterium]|nr:DUF3467 domain-containing protein [Chitinophagia bacterium]
MNDKPHIQEPQPINIELTDEISEGIYSNLAIITHTSGEFVFDFINLMPNTNKAKVKSRIVITPTNAKRFMRALIDNVKKFESQFGTIKDQETPPGGMPMQFGPPTAQA